MPYNSHDNLGVSLKMCLELYTLKKRREKSTTEMSAEFRRTLTPCTPLPVLLSHCQQLFNSIIHGFGEPTHCITLLFSVAF